MNFNNKNILRYNIFIYYNIFFFNYYYYYFLYINKFKKKLFKSF